MTDGDGFGTPDPNQERVFFFRFDVTVILSDRQEGGVF